MPIAACRCTPCARKWPRPCNSSCDGSRKVTGIAEVLPLGSDDDYRTVDIFKFVFTGLDAEGNIQGKHIATGVKPTFYDEAMSQGYDLSKVSFEAE